LATAPDLPPHEAGPSRRTTHKIPEDEAALKSGAHVFIRKRDPVGEVEHMLTDEKSNKATHLVVASGMFSKMHKLIPMTG
jgi:hypothetical protein